MDIFAEKQLHPGFDNPILRHYQEYYDTVFICFSPFFKLVNGDFSNDRMQKSKQISFEELQLEHEIFKNMPTVSANIYSYNNQDYPTDEQIYLSGEPVSWTEIKDACEFETHADVNRALKTSIGAYRKDFQKPALAKKLSDFTSEHQIYHPTEGHFEVLSKKQILKALRLVNKDEVIVEQQFCASKKELKIGSMTEKEFVEAIDYGDYFIYDREKELLFAVDWDDFFFLVCSNRQMVDTLVRALNLEGFYCDDTTETTWDLTQVEIDAVSKKEQQQIEVEHLKRQPVKKPWWKLW